MQLNEDLGALDSEGKTLHIEDYPEEPFAEIVQKINRLTAHAQSAANLRRDFFANASHELKTPITSIKGSAELLCAQVPLDDAQQKDLLTRIGIEADRLHRLIDDIIMINRLESGEIMGLKEEAELSAMVRDCIDAVRPIAENNGLHLNLNLAPATVFINRKNWNEIVSNLMINAINYARPGGTVDVHLAPKIREIILSIRNDAEPIRLEHQARVFERFYRVDRGRSKSVGGTGLGLAIVKHAADSIGATIVLESNEHIGVQLTVTLPR